MDPDRSAIDRQADGSVGVAVAGIDEDFPVEEAEGQAEAGRLLELREASDARGANGVADGDRWRADERQLDPIHRNRVLGVEIEELVSTEFEHLEGRGGSS